MVSVNFQNNVKVYETSGTKINKAAHLPVTSPQTEVRTNPSFRAEAYQSAVTVRTELITREEKKKYNELSEVLDRNYRKKLEYGLKTGILLKNDSADKTSVLDNLHKILKEPRDKGVCSL